MTIYFDKRAFEEQEKEEELKQEELEKKQKQEEAVKAVAGAVAFFCQTSYDYANMELYSAR